MICNTTESCFFELLNKPADVSCDRKPCCVHFCDNRSNAVCTERGKTYHLQNTRDRQCTILSLHIDGGIVVTDRQTPENTSKCDYLFLVDTKTKLNPIAILIELKGTDVAKAVEQISSTYFLFKETLKHCSKVYGRIVCSNGAPRIQNTPTYISLQRLLKQRNGNLSMGRTIIDNIEAM